MKKKRENSTRGSSSEKEGEGDDIYVYVSVYDNVTEKQQGDPQITLRKAAYAVGEVLELNCTSEPARPSPAVTWLLNSKEVSLSLIVQF